MCGGEKRIRAEYIIVRPCCECRERKEPRGRTAGEWKRDDASRCWQARTERSPVAVLHVQMLAARRCLSREEAEHESVLGANSRLQRDCLARRAALPTEVQDMQSEATRLLDLRKLQDIAA